MQPNNVFSFSLNGPTLSVRKVENFEGLEGGLYRRIFIAKNGLWYAELQSEPEQDYDTYFRKALDAAFILIGSCVYECVDLAVVAISPQIGKNCVVVTPGNIYAFEITGTLLPMQISPGYCKQPTTFQPAYPHNQPWFGQQAAEQMLYHRNSMNVKPAGFQSNKPLAATVVNIPHVTYDGVFTEHGGFLHWCSDARGHVTPMPVINPTISFDDRMLLENVLRIMIQNHQHSYPFGIVTPTYGYTSDDPEQHRFGTSEDPIHPL